MLKRSMIGIRAKSEKSSFWSKLLVTKPISNDAAGRDRIRNITHFCFYRWKTRVSVLSVVKAFFLDHLSRKLDFLLLFKLDGIICCRKFRRIGMWRRRYAFFCFVRQRTNMSRACFVRISLAFPFSFFFNRDLKYDLPGCD